MSLTARAQPALPSIRLRVAAEIRAWAARRNVTQTELASALGLAQSAVSQRMRGITPIDIDELSVIAQVCRVSIGELLGDIATDPPPPTGGSHTGPKVSRHLELLPTIEPVLSAPCGVLALAS